MKVLAKALKIGTVAMIVIVLAISCGAAVYAGVMSHICRIRMSYVVDIDAILQEDAQINNTILMIGDGMGVNHIEAAKAYYNLETLTMETLEVEGMMSTFSKTGVTDSAAAATAMSTGIKIHNGGISMDGGKELETLGEYARKQGKSVGIISTEGMNGATPAGFSAHAENRGNADAITEAQLSSGIDLFMGANQSYYDTYEYDIVAAGYDYVTSYDDLNAFSDKIFACFTSVPPQSNTDTAPKLSDLVDFAIDYLEAKSEYGYFLMIEGAHIDKRSHANDMSGVLAEMKSFDESVATVLDKVSEDIFIMVTADHECGDLRYNGEIGADINDSLFHSGSHTGQDVPYFATPQIENLPRKIDNTNIASLYRQLIAG